MRMMHTERDVFSMDHSFFACAASSSWPVVSGLGQRIEDGFPAVNHGAQVIGRGAVPQVRGGHCVVADHVQEGVLKAREGFLAGVLTGGGGTHGHGHVAFRASAQMSR